MRSNSLHGRLSHVHWISIAKRQTTQAHHLAKIGGVRTLLCDELSEHRFNPHRMEEGRVDVSD